MQVSLDSYLKHGQERIDQIIKKQQAANGIERKKIEALALKMKKSLDITYKELPNRRRTIIDLENNNIIRPTHRFLTFKEVFFIYTDSLESIYQKCYPEETEAQYEYMSAKTNIYYASDLINGWEAGFDENIPERMLNKAFLFIDYRLKKLNKNLPNKKKIEQFFTTFKFLLKDSNIFDMTLSVVLDARFDCEKNDVNVYIKKENALAFLHEMIFFSKKTIETTLKEIELSYKVITEREDNYGVKVNKSQIKTKENNLKALKEKLENHIEEKIANVNFSKKDFDKRKEIAENLNSLILSFLNFPDEFIPIEFPYPCRSENTIIENYELVSQICMLSNEFSKLTENEEGCAEYGKFDSFLLPEIYKKFMELAIEDIEHKNIVHSFDKIMNLFISAINILNARIFIMTRNQTNRGPAKPAEIYRNSNLNLFHTNLSYQDDFFKETEEIKNAPKQNQKNSKHKKQLHQHPPKNLSQTDDDTPFFTQKSEIDDFDEIDRLLSEIEGVQNHPKKNQKNTQRKKQLHQNVPKNLSKKNDVSNLSQKNEIDLFPLFEKRIRESDVNEVSYLKNSLWHYLSTKTFKRLCSKNTDFFDLNSHLAIVGHTTWHIEQLFWSRVKNKKHNLVDLSDSLEGNGETPAICQTLFCGNFWSRFPVLERSKWQDSEIFGCEYMPKALQRIDSHLSSETPVPAIAAEVNRMVHDCFIYTSTLLMDSAQEMLLQNIQTVPKRNRFLMPSQEKSRCNELAKKIENLIRLPETTENVAVHLSQVQCNLALLNSNREAFSRCEDLASWAILAARHLMLLDLLLESLLLAHCIQKTGYHPAHRLHRHQLGYIAQCAGLNEQPLYRDFDMLQQKARYPYTTPSEQKAAKLIDRLLPLVLAGIESPSLLSEEVTCHQIVQDLDKLTHDSLEIAMEIVERLTKKY